MAGDIPDTRERPDRLRIYYADIPEGIQLHLGWYGRGSKDPKTAFIDLIAKIIPLRKNKHMTILDAGSGYGIPAIYLAKKYPLLDVFGIDVLEQHVVAANDAAKESRVEARVRFKTGSYLHTGFEAGKFDAIFLLESSCHTSEKRQLLEEMHRILKPGGCLVFFEYVLKRLGSRISTLEYEIIKEGLCIMEFLDESVWELAKEVGLTMDTFVDVTPAVEFGIKKNCRWAANKLGNDAKGCRAHQLALVCVKNLCDANELFYGIVKMKKDRAP